MAMTILETEAIADGALPIAQLAAHLRLPEGYGVEADPTRRLALSLLAAIAEIEARLGKILIAREVRVAGVAEGGRIALPLAPVLEVLRAERDGPEGPIPVAVGEVASEPHWSVVALADPVPEGGVVRLRIRAGYGGWDAVPVGVAQAVILLAAASDGDVPAGVNAHVASLIAPMRERRLGRGRA
ncbi:hypothetical protein ACK8OR_04715 [Jannaschia sp. KMU-145]|uniref:head-tail connector protein n=1 Tax=Jannaschia halovivens TaxID=3388667 RepID=UPI00396AF9FC